MKRLGNYRRMIAYATVILLITCMPAFAGASFRLFSPPTPEETLGKEIFHAYRKPPEELHWELQRYIEIGKNLVRDTPRRKLRKLSRECAVKALEESSQKDSEMTAEIAVAIFSGDPEEQQRVSKEYDQEGKSRAFLNILKAMSCVAESS